MSIKDKIFNGFTQKLEKKIRLNEQSAKLTVFKEDKKQVTKSFITSGEKKEEYPIVEREICPAKIICPDCGGETIEGLEYCDKCGGEINY